MTARSPIVPFAAALLLAGALAAQQRLSLDGTWSLRTDPLDDAHPAPHPIAVPSAWEETLGPQFDGIAWYERELPIPADFHGSARLEFAAVATRATVFCNGIELGQHLGGWTPFRVDATPALAGHDRHVLRVRVDEKVGHNTQGFLPIVQPHFGGIWQGVTLCLDTGPVLDRIGAYLFGKADGTLAFQLGALGDAHEATIHLSVRDGDRELAHAALAASSATGTLRVADVTPWAPGAPRLYTAAIELRAGDTVLDRFERRIGFRDLRADGTRVLWNGQPLQMRGVLHWGFSPPHYAPSLDPAVWRAQLERCRASGFNCLKCCLFVPPPCVYELCDELGLLVWQEYPTWHPQLDKPHQDELLTEYAEFFRGDRNHPSVAFRSITCETGPGADLDVVKALFAACKAAVPDTLLVDDSSWIGWQRITDFWDEHPYGNNAWFPGRLGDFQRHIREHGAKPLLLGECIAADTWFDLARWQRERQDAWWRPDCLDAQVAAERWLVATCGEATLASLRPQSLAFAMRNRQFQIEQLRLTIPDAGYVVSVARDFPKARMGLFDDFDEPKWPDAAWRWHGDTMLCLDLPWSGRALAGDAPRVPVRVAHSGRGPLQGTLTLRSDEVDGAVVRAPIAVAPGAVSEPVALPLGPAPAHLSRVRVTAELAGSHPAQNHWDVWRVPPVPQPRSDVEIGHALTPELLDRLEAGGAAIVVAGEQKGAPRNAGLWFLKGAPFAPPHAFADRVPADALLELSSFDLETGRAMPWDPWRDQIDPILGFWETHDLAEVRWHLFAFTTRVGKGRLAVTTLRLDDGASALGAYVAQQLAEHLRRDAPPQHALTDATLAALRASLRGQRLDLPVWRFRTDPDDQGRAGAWFQPTTDTAAAPWRDLRAGSHWENQAEDLRSYTGVAWYVAAFDVPEAWRGQPARAVFEGVDDSFALWLDGAPAGAFGDPATGVSVWLERQVAELGDRLTPGRHTVALRVVDHGGAGGLWRPVFVTTGPVGDADRFLQ